MKLDKLIDELGFCLIIFFVVICIYLYFYALYRIIKMIYHFIIFLSKKMMMLFSKFTC